MTGMLENSDDNSGVSIPTENAQLKSIGQALKGIGES